MKEKGLEDTFAALKQIAKDEFGVTLVKSDDPATKKTMKQLFGFGLSDIEELISKSRDGNKSFCFAINEDGGLSYMDNVGGVHEAGLGWSPNGDRCGECSNVSCSTCNVWRKEVQ